MGKFTIKTREHLGETVKPKDFNYVEMSIDGKSVKINIEEELKFDPFDMVDAMSKHAGQYGWYASLSCLLRRKCREKKYDLDSKFESLDREARNSLKDQDLKVTEVAVRSYIANDPRVQGLKEEINDIENVQDFVDSMLKSFEHRRDMIKEVNKTNLS